MEAKEEEEVKALERVIPPDGALLISLSIFPCVKASKRRDN